jgi:hypothetical protein
MGHQSVLTFSSSLVTQESKRGINMPYAIFSKRTRIISRIVDDLTSMLASESMIEVDEEINYPKEQPALVRGQDFNTLGLPLFSDNATPTVKSSHVAYDSNGRPYTVKHAPQYIEPLLPGGGHVMRRIDIPIVSNPFAWKAEELFRVKYDSLLAQNTPFDVLIGEEFMSAVDIDAGSSDNYTLTEGVCAIAPGGTVVTRKFDVSLIKSISGITDATDAQTYIFDTYYLDTEPDISPGITIYWKGDKTAGGTTAWEPAVTNTEMPTSEVSISATTATKLKNMQLKFTNGTGGVFFLENYLLYLRLRKTN